MGQPNNLTAGWYPDPAGSGRQRYFDGVQWTDSYAQTFTTVYAAPLPDATTPKPAGWYPDPRGGVQRRYWDGKQWTDSYAEAELPKPELPRGFLVLVGGVTLFLVALSVANAQDGDSEKTMHFLLVALVGAALFGMIVWASRVQVRRKKRQQEEDRQRALAIHAELEDQAFVSGDDLRGMYGQFPPPPEVL
jgi:hypothetical protein